MSQLRPMNLGRNPESFFLNKLPVGESRQRQGLNTYSASPSSLFMRDGLQKREDELKQKLRELQRREAEANMLQNLAQQDLFNVQIDRQTLATHEQNTADQMNNVESTFKSYQLQQRAEELSRLEMQAKLIELARQQKGVEVERQRRDLTRSEYIKLAEDRAGFNNVFNVRVSKDTAPERVTQESFNDSVNRDLDAWRQNPSPFKNAGTKGVTFSGAATDPKYENILKEFDVRTILEMANQHREEQLRKQEQIENPIADESKIMKTPDYKHDIQRAVKVPPNLPVIADPSSAVEEASKTLKEIQKQAQNYKTPRHVSLPSKLSQPPQPRIIPVNKTALLAKREKVRADLKAINRELDEANVVYGESPFAKLQEGEDSFSASETSIKSAGSIVYSDNSAYLVSDEMKVYRNWVKQENKQANPRTKSKHQQLKQDLQEYPLTKLRGEKDNKNEPNVGIMRRLGNNPRGHKSELAQGKEPIVVDISVSSVGMGRVDAGSKDGKGERNSQEVQIDMKENEAEVTIENQLASQTPTKHKTPTKPFIKDVVYPVFLEYNKAEEALQKKDNKGDKTDAQITKKKKSISIAVGVEVGSAEEDDQSETSRKNNKDAKIDDKDVELRIQEAIKQPDRTLPFENPNARDSLPSVPASDQHTPRANQQQLPVKINNMAQKLTAQDNPKKPINSIDSNEISSLSQPLLPLENKQREFLQRQISDQKDMKGGEATPQKLASSPIRVKEQLKNEVLINVSRDGPAQQYARAIEDAYRANSQIQAEPLLQSKRTFTDSGVQTVITQERISNVISRAATQWFNKEQSNGERDATNQSVLNKSPYTDSNQKQLLVQQNSLKQQTRIPLNGQSQPTSPAVVGKQLIPNQTQNQPNQKPTEESEYTYDSEDEDDEEGTKEVKLQSAPPAKQSDSSNKKPGPYSDIQSQPRMSFNEEKLQAQWNDPSFQKDMREVSKLPEAQKKIKQFNDKLPEIMARIDPNKQVQMKQYITQGFFKRLVDEYRQKMEFGPPSQQSANIESEDDEKSETLQNSKNMEEIKQGLKPAPSQSDKRQNPQVEGGKKSVAADPKSLEQKFQQVVEEEAKNNRRIVPPIPIISTEEGSKSNNHHNITPANSGNQDVIKQLPSKISTEQEMKQQAFREQLAEALAASNREKKAEEQNQEYKPENKVKPWVMPEPDKITKHFTINPDEIGLSTEMHWLIKKTEQEYWDSLSNLKLVSIGDERLAKDPEPVGITACAHTKDLLFFAVASASGFVQIFSSRDLAVKGITKVACPVVDLSFQSGVLIAVKANGSVTVFQSNVRPFDFVSEAMLNNFVGRRTDVKQIVPLYEFSPSLNGDPSKAFKENGRITASVVMHGKSIFEHTTVSAVDNGKLLYLNCEIVGESNQRHFKQQKEIIKVNLSKDQYGQKSSNGEVHDDWFNVVYNKKPLHGESRVVSVQKAINKLICSIDSTGVIVFQQESRKVISVGSINLNYRKFTFTSDSNAKRLFPDSSSKLQIDPATVYREDSDQKRAIEQYMITNKIKIQDIKELAVDTLVHPMTGQQVFILPAIKSQHRRIIIVTLNKHIQVCKVAQQDFVLVEGSRKLIKQPENTLFPGLIFRNKGISIDADSGVKYAKDSEQYRAMQKFLSKEENSNYVDEKWLRDHAAETQYNQETGSRVYVIKIEQMDQGEPEHQSEDSDLVPFHVYRFNKANQITTHYRVLMQLTDEPEPASIKNVKLSKEGHLLIIPLVKNNMFGSQDFGVIEFIIFDTTKMAVVGQKHQLNFLPSIEWSYDVTQQLTLNQGYLPYLYFLNGPLLRIVSLTSGQMLKQLDMRTLCKFPLYQVTCLTHRYVLFHSKKTDATFIMTMEDSFMTLNEFNETVQQVENINKQQ